ncbi:MAG: uncharacterized protein KVP18_001124 [Porospora cf. gigantea A]|uniref:uncharacterized protein n=1 Tax=Porospora cf. gigantea A TaxID=2853593 RepID=UPI00355A971D|nr:MAG: hypothetical protein KVP18_001124 [Porospora cf. gigantea A]
MVASQQAAVASLTNAVASFRQLAILATEERAVCSHTGIARFPQWIWISGEKGSGKTSLCQKVLSTQQDCDVVWAQERKWPDVPITAKDVITEPFFGVTVVVFDEWQPAAAKMLLHASLYWTTRPVLVVSVGVAPPAAHFQVEMPKAHDYSNQDRLRILRHHLGEDCPQLLADETAGLLPGDFLPLANDACVAALLEGRAVGWRHVAEARKLAKGVLNLRPHVVSHVPRCPPLDCAGQRLTGLKSGAWDARTSAQLEGLVQTLRSGSEASLVFVEGSAGAGKSFIGRVLAEELGALHLSFDLGTVTRPILGDSERALTSLLRSVATIPRSVVVFEGAEAIVTASRQEEAYLEGGRLFANGESRSALHRRLCAVFLQWTRHLPPCAVVVIPVGSVTSVDSRLLKPHRHLATLSLKPLCEATAKEIFLKFVTARSSSHIHPLQLGTPAAIVARCEEAAVRCVGDGRKCLAAEDFT